MPESDPNRVEIDRLKAQAEAAYDKMYDVYDQGQMRREYEIAYDSLCEAARLAREAGQDEEATDIDNRATHIGKVYRHQFMVPPDLTS